MTVIETQIQQAVTLARAGNRAEAKRLLEQVAAEAPEEVRAWYLLSYVANNQEQAIFYIQTENFGSIPDAMWWGAVTLTTVGYGDAYPQTLLGKILGAAIAMLGIGLFALPAGIIASGFAAEIQSNVKVPQICPHCGKDIHIE